MEVLFMEYVTSKEISNDWSISNRRVNTLCKEGRVAGAYKNGLMWMIPKNAKKPFDERKSKKMLDTLKIEELSSSQIKHEKKLDEDYKKKNGIYYTPYELVDLMYSDLKIPKESIILDPCCGMGSFLVGGLKRGFKNVYGVDNDDLTVKHLNSLLGSDRIVLHDSINNSAESTLIKLGIQKSDFVIGNPPYVTHGSMFGNLFVGSIIRSFDMLKQDGTLSYIIPKNFLHVSTYQELRKEILKSYQIISIVDLGIYFKNVRGEQIVITIKNTKPTEDSKIIFKELFKSKFVEKTKVHQNQFSDIIRVFMSDYELTIFEKLSSAYENFASYCQGYIGRGRSKENSAISGKELKKFGFKNTKVPAEGNKIFIQNIYSAESGIIGSFAGDLEATETVTVITDSTPQICKYLVGILHSRLINYYLFKYCFNGSKLTAHTDRKYISEIPVVISQDEKYSKIIQLVDDLQICDYLSDIWYNKFEALNELIYEIYGLTYDEISFIDTYMKKLQSKRWTRDE